MTRNMGCLCARHRDHQTGELIALYHDYTRNIDHDVGNSSTLTGAMVYTPSFLLNKPCDTTLYNP